MMFKKKSIEIDTLLFNKPPTQKSNLNSNVASIKCKLKSLAMEETQTGHGDITPTFLENDECASGECLTAIEKKIYIWLDEHNIVTANPKEKLYSYFQKNRDKILMGQKLKKGHPVAEIKQESKQFLNFNNSPLLMRREKKVTSEVLNK